MLGVLRAVMIEHDPIYVGWSMAATGIRVSCANLGFDEITYRFVM